MCLHAAAEVALGAAYTKIHTHTHTHTHTQTDRQIHTHMHTHTHTQGIPRALGWSFGRGCFL